jgi:hypothetical protein
MISISEFKDFLKNKFSTDTLYIDEFKPDLQFADIDCFDKQSYKLTLEISTESIKVSTIEKDATLDFSLYDHAFKSNAEAEKFVLDAVAKGYYKKPSR